MWQRAMMSSGGGGTLNPTVIARKRTQSRYTDAVTVSNSKSYIVLTFFFTTDYTEPDFNLYKLVNGTLTLTDSYHHNSSGANVPPTVTISGTTLSINYAGSSYNNGYFVIPLS